MRTRHHYGAPGLRHTDGARLDLVELMNALQEHSHKGPHLFFARDALILLYSLKIGTNFPTVHMIVHVQRVQ